MRITYLFDPLCGWCYGAAPVLERLVRQDGIEVEPAPTGLFAGEGARPMDAAFAAYAWHNDQRIARLTGQVFSDAYRSHVLETPGGLFDSAPATLAIVTVGRTTPARQFEALKALQEARYMAGRDNSDRAIVADILSEAGFPDAARDIRAPDEDLLAAYQARIDAARADMSRFGVQGVPTLLVGEGTARRALPAPTLFGDWDALIRELQAA